jgi:hypothetical protein
VSTLKISVGVCRITNVLLSPEPLKIVTRYNRFSCRYENSVNFVLAAISRHADFTISISGKN